jgi:uncharacterized membrane protein
MLELDALRLPLLAFGGVQAGEGQVASFLALAFYLLLLFFFFFGELVWKMTSDDKEWLDDL